MSADASAGAGGSLADKFMRVATTHTAVTLAVMFVAAVTFIPDPHYLLAEGIVNPVLGSFNLPAIT